MTERGQQKHHFIPRFILRKFAPTEQPPAGPAASPSAASRRRDFLVNKVDLQIPALTQRPVSTEFALVDMYRDPGFDENPNHLEEKLSRLEGRASEIIAKAGRTFAARGSILTLQRIEVDTLRKFLFLMKYRNTGMFDRYNHDDARSYQADDRARMLRYMQTKGFATPRDVWFDNLRQILDLELDDAGRSWRETLRRRIYPDDAAMFEHHLLHSFMAFGEPDDPQEEFLLTENAFGIFEGPCSTTVDPQSGHREISVYTEFHNFAPLAPRLAIILRSNLLPFPGDRGLAQSLRASLVEAQRAAHHHPDEAGSMLLDLPIRPCETSYHNPVVVVVDSPAAFHRNDQFRFQCFRLSSAHVATINSLFLEEAYPTASIVYHSPVSLRASIERYLADEDPRLKQVLDVPGDRRRAYLGALQKVLADLGGSAQCRIHPFDLAVARVRVHMAMNVGLLVGIQLLGSLPRRSLPPVYRRLRPDATLETFWYDLDQARRLMVLRTKIDRAISTSKLTEGAKTLVRGRRDVFFGSFPPGRQWLLWKIARNMSRCDVGDTLDPIPILDLNGPEDAFWTLPF
ncbi:hypothetical protein ASPACDRAFT_48162 [Aspergillus aculeatus ATCC 16872]|uniref:DUF4238 domain-containing protein n=1 Tax=Aspergillus aculeatus (strain ATCC 16872 / CBS 172.66 / WB 5094) TaxID=690307 RepID=A0A1L9WG23_ASPA1|nr:uncharacterized protein ASPACDRAFT_48162 [Aspergillus aculeatus ATCC 16872]OJJ95055.1 hypothetical protein ASPACDRAFT_48162 [Aspergillus aculeatus ATCC 16872]